MTEALLELYGHSRRVGLVEWHPTTNNILFSAGYDYKVSSPAATVARAAQCRVEGKGALLAGISLGATCKDHCYSPELVDQHRPICPFIHSFIPQGWASSGYPVLLGVHSGHLSGSFSPKRLEENAHSMPRPSPEPLLKSRSGYCPLGRKKEQPKLLEEGEWRALKRGVPTSGPWPGTLILLPSIRNRAAPQAGAGLCQGTVEDLPDEEPQPSIQSFMLLSCLPAHPNPPWGVSPTTLGGQTGDRRLWHAHPRRSSSGTWTWVSP